MVICYIVLSSYFLQIEGGLLFLIIIALIIIIPTAVLLSRRKGKPIDNTGIGLLQQQIDAMKNEYGEKINSIPAMDVIQDLEGRMEGINDYVIDTHEKDSRERIEKFTEIKDEMEKVDFLTTIAYLTVTMPFDQGWSRASKNMVTVK